MKTLDEAAETFNDTELWQRRYKDIQREATTNSAVLMLALVLSDGHMGRNNVVLQALVIGICLGMEMNRIEGD